MMACEWLRCHRQYNDVAYLIEHKTNVYMIEK